MVKGVRSGILSIPAMILLKTHITSAFRGMGTAFSRPMVLPDSD